jgi:hypothetical protein
LADIRRWWALQPPPLERIERLLALILDHYYSVHRKANAPDRTPSDYLQRWEPPKDAPQPSIEGQLRAARIIATMPRNE